VSGDFTIDFVPARHLAAASFGEEPLVQVEIAPELPWVMESEKEPD